MPEVDLPQPIAMLQPMLATLRQQLSAGGQTQAGIYSMGVNRATHESYLLGCDAAGREFAFLFSPAEFRQFAEQVQVVVDLLPKA